MLRRDDIMCLGVAGVIIGFKEDNTAVVDVEGISIEADASLVDVRVGDYVIVHAGIIISKIRKEEAELQSMLRRELIGIVEEKLEEYK